MSKTFTAAEVMSEEAYEMVLRLVDRDGYDPYLSRWIKDEEEGWFRADILWLDEHDTPTGHYVRAQEQNGCLSCGCHAADGTITSCFAPKRILTMAELDASLGMIEFHISNGRILSEH